MGLKLFGPVYMHAAIFVELLLEHNELDVIMSPNQ